MHDEFGDATRDFAAVESGGGEFVELGGFAAGHILHDQYVPGGERMGHGGDEEAGLVAKLPGEALEMGGFGREVQFLVQVAPEFLDEGDGTVEAPVRQMGLGELGKVTEDDEIFLDGLGDAGALDLDHDIFA